MLTTAILVVKSKDLSLFIQFTMLLVHFNKCLLNFKHYFEKTEIVVKNTFIGTLGQK